MRTSRRPILGAQNRRGSVLFLTLLFLVLINLFAVAFWKLVPVELHSAKRHQMETEAYFASDAGVVDSVAFLENLTAQGNIDNYFNNNGVLNSDGHLVIARTGTINGWTWEAEIIPGPETFGHNDTTVPNPLRVYKIEAVAKRPGYGSDSQQYRQISAWVKQIPFTDNNWGNMAGVGNLWLFMDSFKLDGDYHTNGQGLLRIENSSFWSNSDAAIGGDFSFHVPVNNPSLGLVDGVKYSSWGSNYVPYWTSGGNAGEPRGNRYDKISANGRAGVKIVDEMQMPNNTDSVAFGAWGDTPPTGALTNAQKLFGSDSDVSLALNDSTPGGSFRNGIYISGDVEQIEFHTTNGDNPADDPENDNQIIRIYQNANSSEYVEITHVTGQNFTIPSGATVVDNTHTPGTTLYPTDNGEKGWTVVRNKSTNEYAIYKEQGNGAIFATGDVEGVRGIVKGRRTVAVATDTGNSTSNDHTIIINGELLYAGTPKGAPPVDGGTMLGLIAYDVRMRDRPASSAPTSSNPQFGKLWPRRSQTNPSNPHYLYTSIFAGRNNDPHSSTSNAGGFGSLSPNSSSYQQGHLYMFGSLTEGVRQWKGTGYYGGNSYEFHLDPNLENANPPFFPALPAFKVLSWEEKSVFSY